MPNRLWFSKSGDLFCFDIGTGLDDEAIEFGILSDQVNTIKALVSARHLLVFTTGAEWMVSGNPLTPTSIQLSRQTSTGSYDKCCLYPQQIDGATVFVSQSGHQLRESGRCEKERGRLFHPKAVPFTLHHFIPRAFTRPCERTPVYGILRAATRYRQRLSCLLLQPLP